MFCSTVTLTVMCDRSAFSTSIVLVAPAALLRALAGYVGALRLRVERTWCGGGHPWVDPQMGILLAVQFGPQRGWLLKRWAGCSNAREDRPP